jgi:hypothetical protein
MRKISQISYIALIIIALLTSIFFTDCNKNEEPLKFPYGTFPDSVINLQGLNSVFDDYNSALFQLTGSMPIIFSSNRQSSGGQFDLEQGLIACTFDQTNGNFILTTALSNDPFLDKLISAAVTPLDDFGPYRLYNPNDGFEYFLVSSENSEGNLDLRYLKNRPFYGNTLPDIEGPNPIKLLNTTFDDAYLSFNLNLDSAYFMSNIDGDFNIYVKTTPAGKNIDAWFDSDYSASSKVDSINSSSDDKCPILFNNFMVFTSNRPGGQGKYDLYYSVFKNGNWSSPVNFGPGINSASDEFRPMIGYHPYFTNIFMIFSSDRPDGNGGFDLYFTGIELPEN